MDIFGIKTLKKENLDLKCENGNLNSKLDIAQGKLEDYSIKESLGRIIEVPRNVGLNVYVIMRSDLHQEYDKELIGMRRSDNPNNNIKIIQLTISAYIKLASGLFFTFKEQYGENKFYMPVDSFNLFLSMDAAIAEMYSRSSDKSKYMDDPFIELSIDKLFELSSDNK